MFNLFHIRVSFYGAVSQGMVWCTLIWKLQVPEPGVARPGTDGADTCRTQIQFLASFLVLHHSHVSGPGAGDV